MIILSKTSIIYALYVEWFINFYCGWGQGLQTGPGPSIGFSGGSGQQGSSTCAVVAAKAAQTPMIVAEIVKIFILIILFCSLNDSSAKTSLVKLNEWFAEIDLLSFS